MQDWKRIRAEAVHGGLMYYLRLVVPRRVVEQAIPSPASEAAHLVVGEPKALLEKAPPLWW